MEVTRAEMPSFVQNRCYARFGWDRDVRLFCRERNINYQGFSLLTANPEVLRDPLVTCMAMEMSATPAQIVFAFCLAVGILPLTGTSDPEHMRQDLAARQLKLAPETVQVIESLAG
jgi:diketogulonate reductase-like aldo/keto reductase